MAKQKPFGNIKYTKSLGVGTCVKLDYSENSDSRNEYAVWLISDDWDSLGELLYDPQAFVEDWRSRYSSTPLMFFGSKDENDTTTQLDEQHEWTLVGPLTITIEPLTVRTPQNVSLLHGLKSYYPQLAGALTAPASAFSSEIRNALAKPVKKKDYVPSPNPFGVSECDMTPSETAESMGTSPPQGGLAYVVQFAVQTRALTIKYVSRDVKVTKSKTHKRWFQSLKDYTGAEHDPAYKNNGFDHDDSEESFTGVNFNNPAGTDLIFMHYDIAFADKPNKRSHHDVAKRRAQFVMSFLENPVFMNDIKRNQDQTTSAFMKVDRKANALLDSIYAPISTQQKFIDGTEGQGPTVIIDSVYSQAELAQRDGTTLRNGKKGSTAKLMSGPEGPDVPFICVVGQTYYDAQNQGWVINGVFVKAYLEPAGGG
jgi:hypothetical protein